MPSSAQIGERIAQARKRLGLTQAMLADKLGLARTTLVAMEKGERPPSNAEIVKIAAELKITVNELLREHTVVADASPRFRIGLSQRREHEAEFEAAVESLKALGRRYTELERVLSMSRVPAPLESINTYRSTHLPRRFDARVAGEDAAAFLRRQLGLGDGPALSLESRLELEAGLRIFRIPLPGQLAAILLWSDEMGACVALNRYHPHERHRWSLVHELGHFLRDREAGDLLPGKLESRNDPSERFCEAMAAEFLMPASGLRRRFAEHVRDKGVHFSVADLLALARFYQVSFEAMTLRLEELELLPGGTFDSLKRRRFRPETARRELGFETTRAKIEHWLPARYERLAFEAYAQELLSETELAQYLHTDRVTARGLYLTGRVAVADGGNFDLDLGEDVLEQRPAS